VTPQPLVTSATSVTSISRTDIVRYQGASGDMHPLHHDETFARAAGYDAPLAIGMLAAGMLASYATDWLGAANVRRFRIRFRSQAWPGDALTCGGAIVREYEGDAGPMADVELTCTRQTGDVTVQAWATFVREG
jgi:acyl dehydratase